jgi:hypothetical protein
VKSGERRTKKAQVQLVIEHVLVGGGGIVIISTITLRFGRQVFGRLRAYAVVVVARTVAPDVVMSVTRVRSRVLLGTARVGALVSRTLNARTILATIHLTIVVLMSTFKILIVQLNVIIVIVVVVVVAAAAVAEAVVVVVAVIRGGTARAGEIEVYGTLAVAESLREIQSTGLALIERIEIREAERSIRS